MNTIAQVEGSIASAAPGTTLEIKGYIDSSGVAKDLTVELIGSSDYAAMQAEDLARLRAADVADMTEGGEGDLQMTDLIAARDQLIEARALSLAKRREGELDQRGPTYESAGGCLGRLPDKPGSLYILRTKVVGAMPYPKPAKGAIPRAKQKLIQVLDLPTRRYVHSLRLDDGKFDTLTVKRLVQVPA